LTVFVVGAKMMLVLDSNASSPVRLGEQT